MRSRGISATWVADGCQTMPSRVNLTVARYSEWKTSHVPCLFVGLVTAVLQAIGTFHRRKVLLLPRVVLNENIKRFLQAQFHTDLLLL